MEENTIQEQIDSLNQKVDQILDYVNDQRLKANSLEDLVTDVSIIGKDMYDSTVTELENQMVEIDPDEMRMFAIRLVKNIPNFNNMLDMVESVTDLAKDASPIANELIIELTRQLHDFEQKGYFEFIKEIGKIADNIVAHFKPDDVKLLADNVVSILETVKNLTQPDVMTSVDNAVKVFRNLETENIPEYSIWKLMREMGKPEMKRALGFMMTFLKNISAQNGTSK